jgi:hypothetical protein
MTRMDGKLVNCPDLKMRRCRKRGTESTSKAPTIRPKRDGFMSI